MSIHKHAFKCGDHLVCINDDAVGLTLGKVYTALSDPFIKHDGNIVILIESDGGNASIKLVKRFKLLGTRINPMLTTKYKEDDASKQKENNYMESLEQLYNKYSGKVFGILVLILIDEVLLKGRIRKKLTESLHNIVSDVMSTVDSDKTNNKGE